MADFVLTKKKPFTFSMEGSKKVYELPPFSKLTINEISIFQKMQDAEMEGLYKEAKSFILEYIPELDGQLGDYEFMQIFGAYAKSQKSSMGES